MESNANNLFLLNITKLAVGMQALLYQIKSELVSELDFPDDSYLRVTILTYSKKNYDKSKQKCCLYSNFSSLNKLTKKYPNNKVELNNNNHLTYSSKCSKDTF